MSPVSPPSGTVTFLFTDVEGSTRLWEQHRGAMRDVLQRHDEVLRGSIEAAGGYVFTTAGDAFSAAFSDPSKALGAALAIQRAMADEDWGAVGRLAVRTALHTGVAHERDGDYFGPALNRAARILSAGHGGQILLSLGTEEILGDSPDGIALRDLGEHTLKDLGRPERIFQVVADGLRDDFPPLASVDAHPNNLPIQLTSFVGRELELAEVVKRLADQRLLTLTGVGGSGKTRLALQAAAESIANHPHGVWLVELASIGDAELIAHTIGETLGITRSQGGAGNAQLGADPVSVLDQVTGHLRSRTVLLVLDNCEHLITATARIVQHLLQNCPDLTVLATSREGLGVPGEALWQVPSLQVDVDEDPLAVDAVRLFVERAQDADSRFTTDPDTLRWVTRICDRLDGMPLAIELAAARSRVLDARQIAERLDDQFRLLTGGSRTALPRHQTLEATVDWSYDLMTEEERIVFRRLAAFRGGFTLEAAERVCAGGPVDTNDILDLLGSLVDKSMVARDDVSGRFRMLETLRQYALRRLTESDEVDAVRIAHAEHFAAFVADQAPHLRDAGEAEAYQAISADHDNLRAALAYCLENGRERTAVSLAADLAWFWWSSSDTIEGLTWLERVMPYLDDAAPRTQATVIAFAGGFAGWGKDPEAGATAQRAVEIARDAEDPYAEAVGYMAMAMIVSVLRRYDEASAQWRHMLDAAERAGDDWLIGQAHLFSGFTDRVMSRLDEAAAHLVEAEKAFRRTGTPSGLGWVLVTAGQVARYQFDFQTEVVKQREARRYFEETGAPFEISFTLICEGIALVLDGRPAEAVEVARRGFAIRRDLALQDTTIESLTMLAWMEGEAGELPTAMGRLTEALELSAPGLDPGILQVIAQHVSLVLALAGSHEDSARCEGYFQANQRRAEPEIYARHFEPFRARRREALGDRAEALIEEGRSMDHAAFHAYALRAIDEARSTLDSPG